MYYVHQALERGELQVYEQILDVDGEQRYEEIRVAPLDKNDVLVIIRDITEQKLAEAERLQAYQTQQELTLLEQILEVVLAGYWDWDMANDHAYLSPSFKRMFGYTDDELPNAPDTWKGLIVPEDLPIVLACLDRHVQSRGKIPFYTEIRYCHRDGSTVWVICSGQVIQWDEADQPLRMVGCHIDITERARLNAARQQIEAELLQANQHMEAVFAAFPDLLFYLSADGTIQDFRARSDRDLSTVPPHFLGQRVQAILPADVGQRIYEAIQQAIASKSVVSLEYALSTGDCDQHFYEARLVALDSSSVIAITRDITDRKQAELSLEQALQALDTHFQESPLAIIQWGKNFEILRWSKQAEQMFGWKADEVNTPAWKAFQFIYEDDVATVQQTLANLHNRTVSSQTNTNRNYTKDGRVLLCKWYSSAVFDEAGNLESILSFVEDVTERQQTEVALNQAKEAAEVANQAKSAFLSNMSHELRTPLNIILGFADLMIRDPQLASTHQENLKAIQTSGEHLLRLINDVLDLAKIEAGKLSLDLQPIDLRDRLDNVKCMLEQRAIQKGLTLELDIDPNLPPYIIADAPKLQQILINLIGNAIKFTKHGSVTLRVTQTQSPDKLQLPGALPNSLAPILLNVQIIDTGVGIPPDEVEAIFDAFIQTAVGQRSKDGTGLGLPISRRLVQLMDGQLTVTSTVGQGSTFQFSIPVQPTSKVVPPTIAKSNVVTGLAPNQPHYRILVVDDQTVNRKLLVKLLQPLGFEVFEAKNGGEAISQWQQHHPHLIWMDMRMPGMDGYEATRTIRALEAGEGMRDTLTMDSLTSPSSLPSSVSTVIIALTAEASVEDRDRALAIGCSDYLTKPFRVDTLFEKLAGQLGVRYTYADAAPAVPHGETVHQLTVESLAVMPLQWVVSLYHAALSCNDRLVIPLLDEIPSEYASLAQRLEYLACNFEFEQILDVTIPYLK